MMHWQPTHTIPADADFIIAAWWRGGEMEVGEAWRDEIAAPTVWFSAMGNERIIPTHWMPLPDPPIPAPQE